jgi:integrase
MPKTRRRGSIKKRGKNSWLVTLFLGVSSEGKRLIHTKTIRGTKKEAEQYLNRIVRERDLGIFVDTPAMTLNEYFDKWLNSVSKLRNDERTSHDQESIYNRYFNKTIGYKKLENLNVLDVQKVYGEMLARGLSAQTVKHAHSVLRCALKQAVKWNLLPRNPSEFVELPKVQRKERRVFTAEEARRFIAASDKMKHGLVFEFALLTGMRPEEYLATQWGDIDFEGNTVQVRRALIRHKKKWSFKEPKTSRSRRTVVLPSPLVHKLIKHKSKQIIQKLKAGDIWENNDLVFCSEFGTPHSIPNLTYRYFRPILKEAELPQIRLYDLRHTHATLLLMAEENPKVVAERLGHSTIVLTLDTYSHVLPTMQRKATDKLEKILFG